MTAAGGLGSGASGSRPLGACAVENGGLAPLHRPQAAPPPRNGEERRFSTPPLGGSDKKAPHTLNNGRGVRTFLSLPPRGGVEKSVLAFLGGGAADPTPVRHNLRTKPLLSLAFRTSAVFYGAGS